MLQEMELMGGGGGDLSGNNEDDNDSYSKEYSDDGGSGDYEDESDTLYIPEVSQLAGTSSGSASSDDESIVCKANKTSTRKIYHVFKTQSNPRRTKTKEEEKDLRFAEFITLIGDNQNAQKNLKVIEAQASGKVKKSKIQMDQIFSNFIYMGMTERQARAIFQIGSTRFKRLHSNNSHNSSTAVSPKKKSSGYSDEVIDDLQYFVKSLALEPGFACQHKEQQLWYLDVITDWNSLYAAYKEWCSLPLEVSFYSTLRSYYDRT